MRRAALLLALPLALAADATAAESLVSTLSANSVEITSNFTGEEIVVFGAVRGAPAGDPGYQVAVVVQGPAQDIVVRKKERVLGVWVNRVSHEFKEVPSYYVMHLSENFSATLTPADLIQYRLGVGSLPFVADAGTEPAAARFAAALVDLRTKRGLYAEKKQEVQFLAPDVFRTTFFLPSDIPTGEYRVSVYLFRGKTLLAGDSEALTIEKGGFSERITRAALDFPLSYGLVCVALAVFTGWLAGVIFRRP